MFWTILLVVAVGFTDGQTRPRVEVQPHDIIVASHHINITIYCVTSGNPKPTVEWFYDGEYLEIEKYKDHFTLTNDGSLHISQVGQEDEGEYQCIASNPVGTVMSEKAIVKFPYLNKFTYGDSALTLDEGKPLKMKCHPPDSFPSREIYWSKFVFGMPNTRLPLPPSDHYSVSSEGDLYFSSLRQSHSGYYTCVVSNVMLSQHVIRTVSLTVTPVNGVVEDQPLKIFPEFSETKMALKGKKFTLECIASGSNIPKISIKKKGSSIELGRQTGNMAVYVIQSFSEQDEGKYRCKIGKKVKMGVLVEMQAEPRWVIKPSDAVADINGSFTWPCKASANPPVHYEWYFNSIILHPSPRYTFSGGNITIKDLKHKDSGIYQCIAINRYGELTSAMELKIQEIPAGFGPGSRRPTNAHALAGSTAELVCNPSGAPKPTVRWRFGRKYLQNGGKYTKLANGNLLIHSVTAADEGSYTCEVENTLGFDKAKGRLNVRGDIAITHPPEKTTVTVGETINLVCGVTTADILEVTIDWMKNYFPIIHNDRIRKGMSSRTKGYLQINNSIYDDDGLYSCQAKATGSAGASDMAYTTVIIQGPPDPPTMVRVSDPAGRKVRVHWKLGGYNHSPIKKVFVQYETLQNPNIWITAKDDLSPRSTSVEVKLSPYVFYKFRVIVTNGVGNATSKETRMIQTPAATPDVAPQDVTAKGLTPSTLTVTWKPLTQIQHNGPDLHYVVYYRPFGETRMNLKDVRDSTKLTIKGKSFFVKYELQVQAKNAMGGGPKSPMIYGFTGQRAPVGRPQDLEIQIISATQAYATWTGVVDHKEYTGGKLLGYKLYFWSTKDELKPNNANYKKTKETETPVELNAFTNYRFQVFAYNMEGDGPGSNIFGPTTTPEDKPDEPVDLTISISTPKSRNHVSMETVTLQWSPPRKPNGLITGYRVGVRKLPTGNWNYIDIPGLYNVHQFQGLNGFSQYEFSIEAKTKRGRGPPATAIFDLVTIPREAPKDVKVILNKDASEAVISWKPSKDKNIDGYKVIYWAENKPEKQIKIKKFERKTKINHLRRYRKYFFQVASYQVINDEIAMSPKSDAIIVDNGAAIRTRQSDVQSDEPADDNFDSSSGQIFPSGIVLISALVCTLWVSTIFGIN